MGVSVGLSSKRSLLAVVASAAVAMMLATTLGVAEPSCAVAFADEAGEQQLAVSAETPFVQAFDRVVMVGHGRVDRGWGFRPVALEASIDSGAVQSTPFLIDATGDELKASIASVVSSDTSVVKIMEVGPEGFREQAYEAVGVGTATLVLTDKNGNEYKSTITVLSKQDYLDTYVKFKNRSMTMSVGDRIANGNPVGTAPVNDLLVCGTNYFGSDFTSIVMESSDSSIVECWNKPVTLALTAKAAGDVELYVYCIDDTKTGARTLCDTLKVHVAAKEIASTDDGSGFDAVIEAADDATIGSLAPYMANGLGLSVQPQATLTPQAQQAVNSLAKNGAQVAETLDIHFNDGGGAKIEIGDPLSVTVKLQLTDAMKKLAPTSLKVHYIADDGTVEDKNTWIEGDRLCFTTEHFSTYAVTGTPATPEADGQDPKPNDEQGAAGSGGNDGDAASSDSVSLDASGDASSDNGNSSSSAASKLAATGDTGMLAIASLVTIVSLCVLGMAISHRRRVR